MKNVLLVNALLTILFLSDTYGGRSHDKRIAEATPYPLPAGSRLLQDLGFLAFTLPQVEILMPTKKPCGRELTLEEKLANQALHYRRLRIEYVNSSVAVSYLLILSQTRHTIVHQPESVACGKGYSMIQPVDLHRDLAGLPMLKERYGHPTDAESLQSFATLAAYRDGGIFATHFSGSSGWERHPHGDEVVQILAGATRFDIIVDEVMQSLELSAGMLVVVPQGCWHRFESESGVKVLTVTPKPTQHTHVDDPRTAVVED